MSDYEIFELGDVTEIIPHTTTETRKLRIRRADSTATPGAQGSRCNAQQGRCLFVVEE